MSPLLPRMWELRDNLAPHDAAYVALAELTGAILVAGDERITAAPGTRCDIRHHQVSRPPQRYLSRRVRAGEHLPPLAGLRRLTFGPAHRGPPGREALVSSG
jgi:hypothetical protein